MSAITPAVVLGAGVNGLGVARSLARERVPVWLLDADGRRPEMRTRVATPLTLRSLHGEALIDELVRLGTSRFSGVRPVLFLTQEESVKAVSRYRDRLSPLYRFSLPARDTVDALLHKHGFQRVAEQLGSPIPPLVHVRTPADLPAVERLRHPVAIKPGERNADYGRHFKKAYRADTPAESVALLQRILPVMADVVVQEWIEGPDANIHFCLQYMGRDGRVAASFTGRKIRSWPPQVGGTASCIAAPEVHAELSAMTTRFFRAAGVIGMASMEYKRDTRSHDFRMVEPTVGRTDYQEEVATLNGVNLPHAAWCAELDLPLPAPLASGRPVAWRVRSEDRQSAVAQGQGPKQGYPSGTRVADAWWRRDDPMPYLAERFRYIERTMRNRASKLLARRAVRGGP